MMQNHDMIVDKQIVYITKQGTCKKGKGTDECALYNNKRLCEKVFCAKSDRFDDCDVVWVIDEVHTSARSAYAAWLAANEERRKPDQSNHYISTKASTKLAHAMLQLGSAIDAFDKDNGA